MVLYTKKKDAEFTKLIDEEKRARNDLQKRVNKYTECPKTYPHVLYLVLEHPNIIILINFNSVDLQLLEMQRERAQTSDGIKNVKAVLKFKQSQQVEKIKQEKRKLEETLQVGAICRILTLTYLVKTNENKLVGHSR